MLPHKLRESPVFRRNQQGEIPNREAALAGAREVLKPGGVLSITEIIADPHYQRLSTVRWLAQAAGFRLAQVHGRWYHFTANFVKEASGAP